MNQLYETDFSRMNVIGTIQFRKYLFIA